MRRTHANEIPKKCLKGRHFENVTFNFINLIAQIIGHIRKFSNFKLLLKIVVNQLNL
jgi:hypothetical protein